MAVKEGARHRLSASVGVSGSTANYGPFINAGAPTDGGAGTGTWAGYAEKGGLLIDITNANWYINAGSISSVTWKLVTRAA